MKILDVVCSKGRTGFYFDDQRAIKLGAKADGSAYIGSPVTPGFTAVRQAVLFDFSKLLQQTEFIWEDIISCIGKNSSCVVCKRKRRKPTPGEMSCLTTLCLVVLDCLEPKVEGLYQLKILTLSIDCINLKTSSAKCLN